jgi:hypothetical protein
VPSSEDSAEASLAEEKIAFQAAGEIGSKSKGVVKPTAWLT